MRLFLPLHSSCAGWIAACCPRPARFLPATRSAHAWRASATNIGSLSSPGRGAGRPQCRPGANCDGCAYLRPAFSQCVTSLVGQGDHRLCQGLTVTAASTRGSSLTVSSPGSGEGRPQCRPRANCDSCAYFRTDTHSPFDFQPCAFDFQPCAGFASSTLGCRQLPAVFSSFSSPLSRLLPFAGSCPLLLSSSLVGPILAGAGLGPAGPDSDLSSHGARPGLRGT